MIKKKTYFDGLVTAYERVLGYIDIIDNNQIDPLMNILKERINLSLNMFGSHTKKDDDSSQHSIRDLSDDRENNDK